MAELTWDDKYSTGVREIDDEHKELFDTLREIDSAISRKADAAETGAFLKKLTAATSKHFADEEAMMHKTKYPGMTLHIANHQRLMEKLGAFSARHSRDGAQLNQHALSFLRDWLLYHIENDDTRYGDWLKDLVRKQGLAPKPKPALQQNA